MRRTILLLAAAVLLLAGCESAPIKAIQQEFKALFKKNEGEPQLAAGVSSYENGNYAQSARELQAALDAGLSNPDQVRAHKYLAFINCVSGRQTACRNEFRKAVAIDPDFELAPAEAGHPIWGPVFEGVKGRR